MGAMFDIGGRVAVVTGGGQGVGRHVCLLLAEHGADVVVNDLVAERAEKVAAEVEELGRRALAVPCDVTDPEQVRRMAGDAAQLGEVSIVVNNAGVPPLEVMARTQKLFVETSPDDWEPYIKLNLYGVLYVTRAFIEGMLRSGWGRVVTVISDAARTGDARLSAYAAAKAGAAGFMRSLATEVGRYGVTANCVALGATKTESMVKIFPPAELEKVARRYPLRRLAEPREPASVIFFLCSPAASFVTGQVYPVNGGFSYNA